ncbi:class I SAM-dependent methyltransferase [Candidatus Bathyarchaeota archaeon]|nr:MAG: class I SAM-dependent methyltransferase [Candidatus Bathyarchaeota archaeon]
MKVWRDHDRQLGPPERFNALREEYIDIALPAKDAETITKWYDALSKNYDELYGEEQNKKHAKVQELLGNRAFKIIVDVGCGTGKLLGLISPRSQVGLGIDLSVEMLNIAKQRTKESGIQLVRADASHMPLQDHVADGVTSVSMTESGPVLKEHFNELSRIATEDGALVMTIFDDKDQASWKQLSEPRIELVASLSDREQLYLLDRAKHRVRASAESSALV